MVVEMAPGLQEYKRYCEEQNGQQGSWRVVKARLTPIPKGAAGSLNLEEVREMVVQGRLKIEDLSPEIRSRLDT